MPYAHRLIHDADAHVMELPGWLDAFADAGVRERLRQRSRPGFDADRFVTGMRTLHADPAFRAGMRDEVLLRKNHRAPGAFDGADRSTAIDALGFASQLVFTTAGLIPLGAAEAGPDVDYASGLARAHNRAMLAFCAADPRLLPVGYVPLGDFEHARAITREAIDDGCRALMITSACPRGHSPSHVGLYPVWAQAQEAGVPIVFHVGSVEQLMDHAYFVNGLPPVQDFRGGDGTFRSNSYLSVPNAVMQTLATLIIDGVFDRFPRLRFGVIEQGAVWLPGFMRQLDSAATAFARFEERLQKLELRLSEYVTRQLRVTPYPHEDVGWVIAQAGEGVCMFSSDFPHVEGGRNPIRRFEDSLRDVGERAKQRFYCDNFVDLMGPALAGLPAAAAR
jgi:predicted TIM-barrel fold metal-dependent hydrolase